MIRLLSSLEELPQIMNDETQPLLGNEQVAFEQPSELTSISDNPNLATYENPWRSEGESEQEDLLSAGQTQKTCLQNHSFKLFISLVFLAFLMILYFSIYFVFIPIKVQNALNGQGSIVKHVHIQDLGLASSIMANVSVFIPFKDPTPVDAIVEFGPLSVSHVVDKDSGNMNPLASFQLNNLHVAGNSPFAWINSSLIVENLNSAHVAWLLKSIVSNNLALPNFTLTGTPTVGIPILAGKWKGILNRLYDMKSTTDSSTTEAPSSASPQPNPDSSFQNLTVHNATIDISLSSRGVNVSSFIQAGFLNMLPLTVDPQDFAFDFWIYYKKLPVVNFMYLSTKYGLGLSSGFNNAVLDAKISIIDMTGAVQLLADWLGLREDSSRPATTTSVELRDITIGAGSGASSSRWIWLQNLLSGLSLPLPLPKNTTSKSFHLDPSLFNASLFYGQCSVNMSIATLVIDGYTNYTNPFFLSLVDPVSLNFEVWLTYKNVSTVKITSTTANVVSLVHGTNTQLFNLTAKVTDMDMATELFGRYASGQSSVVRIGRMKIQNALDDTWYWMNGMLDSLSIPLTIPGAPEDDGGEDLPFPDCQMS